MNSMESLKKLEYINDDIKKYEQYINLISKTKLDIGNLNCYIKDNSDISLSKDCVKRIINVLKKSNYKGIEKYEVKYIRQTKELEKIYSNSIVVIELQGDALSWNSNSVSAYIDGNISNIYCLVNKDIKEFSKEHSNLFFWKFKLEPLNENQKAKYIKETIKNSGYKINKDTKVLDTLKRLPIKKINDVILETIIKQDSNSKENNKYLEDSLFDFEKEDIKTEVKMEEEINSIDKLNNMIGLENVKKQVKRIRDYLEINKNRNNMPALHIVMRGNPGTGKTTVARILADIFKELKIFKTNNFVEATRETLIGSYVRTHSN